MSCDAFRNTCPQKKQSQFEPIPTFEIMLKYTCPNRRKDSNKKTSIKY